MTEKCVNTTDPFTFDYIKNLSYPDLYFMKSSSNEIYCILINNLYYWIFETYDIHEETGKKAFEYNPRNPFTNEVLNNDEIKNIIKQYKDFKLINKDIQPLFTQDEFDDFIKFYENDEEYMETMEMLLGDDSDEYKKIIEMEKLYKENYS